jgi:asparagine synthase (glutamine-hydrolysing)
MCGIAGFLFRAGAYDTSTATAIARGMAKSLIHRGPDGTGEWVGDGIAMAHRRLSIIDLTAAGAQPMVSACGRFILVFNGEIYNHRELRIELEESGKDIEWRGGSDTETLIELISAFGVSRALSRISGMYAFAVWDKVKMELYLCRDRFGEKPLYYGWQGNGLRRGFIFASELKSFRKHPSFERQLNLDAANRFFERNYVPGPSSIYENILKVKPGCFVTVCALSGETRETAYYSVFDAALAYRKDSNQLNLEDLSEELLAVLEAAVKSQMVSDRRVGAFLSGGIDSSTVVALAQRVSHGSVKTFSLGFEESEFNEAHDAAQIASYLGTEHSEIYISSSDALSLIPKLSRIYCEPFADFSQIPTVLLSRFVSNSVTVAITGDAGDELFGGYSRYQMLDSLWSRSRFPSRIIRSLGRLGANLPYKSEIYRSVNRAMRVIFGHDWASMRNVDRFEWLLLSGSFQEFYYRYLSHLSGLRFMSRESFCKRISLPSIENLPRDFSGLSAVEQMMLLDFQSYLPDDLLVKVDRASMSASLETRIPFLDPRVVALAWRIPLPLKSNLGVGKIILRHLNSKLIPSALMSRKKKGFGVPIGEWLRGPLRPWADSCFNARSLQESGIINTSLVKAVWKEHLSRNANWEYFLWNVLMFQGWMDEQSA